jgi:urease accessory protein
LPAEIAASLIHIRDDHVIAEMVRGLGGEVRVVSRPFNPEGGAYGQSGVHAHGHQHGHHHHAGDGDHHHH